MSIFSVFITLQVEKEFHKFTLGKKGTYTCDMLKIS